MPQPDTQKAHGAPKTYGGRNLTIDPDAIVLAVPDAPTLQTGFYSDDEDDSDEDGRNDTGESFHFRFMRYILLTLIAATRRDSRAMPPPPSPTQHRQSSFRSECWTSQTHHQSPFASRVPTTFAPESPTTDRSDSARSGSTAMQDAMAAASAYMKQTGSRPGSRRSSAAGTSYAGVTKPGRSTSISNRPGSQGFASSGSKMSSAFAKLKLPKERQQRGGTQDDDEDMSDA